MNKIFLFIIVLFFLAGCNKNQKTIESFDEPQNVNNGSCYIESSCKIILNYNENDIVTDVDYLDSRAIELFYNISLVGSQLSAAVFDIIKEDLNGEIKIFNDSKQAVSPKDQFESFVENNDSDYIIIYQDQSGTYIFKSKH
ncbi:MAG: hypothetical protein IKX97_07045 [Erysipelotrichaceae bacterium]|nr:hypothetical protein [Erysipelotrichaceae bacterium]